VTKPIRTSPFIFRWEVEEDGYEWKQQRKTELRLVGRGGRDSRIMRYAPMEEFPGLFLEFAKLKPTQESVCQFANRYGLLFEYSDIEDVVVQRGRMLLGSTLPEWNDEIGRINAIVNLWEAVEGRKIEELQKVIKWNDNGVKYWIKSRSGAQWGSVLAHTADADYEVMIARFKSGNILQPARYALRREINRRIATATTVPRLMWAPGEQRHGQPLKPDAHMRIAFVPSNLLAAMWLQFAQAVTGEYKLRTCKGCLAYFQVGPGGKRADADTCSPKCRQRKKRRMDGREKSLR
jgi:hypothetical protein